MTTPHLVDPGRTIVTQGFTRLRYGLLLGGIAVAVALFILVSVTIIHGLYALIVLPLCAFALALWGGPERLARQIVVSSEGLRIDRFHRVRTVVEWAELDEVTARLEADAKGRSRALLILDPADPEIFFHRHHELRAGRRGDVAVIPVGRAEETVSALVAAVTAFQP